ncbi:MAG: glutamate-cysteine ligase family protein [Deltaproteobacteria bacterium]
MTRRPFLSLFAGYGVELEYMIVDRETLAVYPVADRILRTPKGKVTEEVEAGPLSWSNELALHVIELKTSGPAPSLSGLAGTFAEHVGRIERLLEPLGGRLMPTAMHPWMDPAKETRLWPHGYRAVYEAYDRIFGCGGHGWSNLQCIHLNLPFAGDGEFGRLHAAIRLVLPILPALCASSPVVEGRITGLLDSRLEVYRTNQRKIPSITGRVIPEPVFTKRTYRERILYPAYCDLAPHDPDRILRHEWVNSRGAIARFDRGTIEIRLPDMQECPAADLAVVGLVTAAVHALVEELHAPYDAQKAWEIEPLERILLATIREGERARIGDRRYIGLFGLDAERATAGELWRHLAESFREMGLAMEDPVRSAAEAILEEGPLARRILRALGRSPSRRKIREVYGELCDCLREGRIFTP